MLHRLHSTSTALVLDVDGTLLSSGEEVLFVDTCLLARLSHALGIDVFVVTAREFTPFNLAYTLNQLEQCHVPFHSLFMRKANAPVLQMKTESRDFIGKHSRILASIGDNWTDITGETPPECLEYFDGQSFLGRCHDIFFLKLPME
jgi:hypothetical protein